MPVVSMPVVWGGNGRRCDFIAECEDSEDPSSSYAGRTANDWFHAHCRVLVLVVVLVVMAAPCVPAHPALHPSQDAVRVHPLLTLSVLSSSSSSEKGRRGRSAAAPTTAENEGRYHDLLLDPHYQSTWETRGAIEQSQGRHEEAAYSFHKALRLAPWPGNRDAPDIMYNHANALLAIGALPQAIAAFRRVVTIRPRDADAWFNMANAYSDSGSPSDALEALEEAIRLRPADPDGPANRGALMLDLARPGSAAEAYSEAIALRPTDADLHWNRGVVLAEGLHPPRLSEARTAFTTAVELRPRHLRALRSGCRAAFEQGDMEEARRWCGRAHTVARERRESRAEAANSAPGATGARATTDVAGNLGFDGGATGMADGGNDGLEGLVPDEESDLDDTDYEDRGGTVLQILASSLHQLGRLREARDTYKEAIAMAQAEPKGSDSAGGSDVLGSLWAGLGAVQAALGEPAAALASFDHVISRSHQPDSEPKEATDGPRRSAPSSTPPSLLHPGVLANMANVHLELGHRDEALRLLSRAVQAAPRHANTRFNYANALLDVGKNREALAEFRRVLLLQPGDAGSVVNAGLALLRDDRLDEAVLEYKRATTIDPSFFTAWLMLGNAHMRAGSSSDAVAAYRHAVRSDSAEPAGLANLGVALSSLNRGAEALEAFEQALELRPDHANTWANRATELINNGGSRGGGSRGRHHRAAHEALASYDHAVRLDDSLAEAWYNRGFLLASLGRRGEAAESFRGALRAEPGHFKALHHLAAVAPEYLDSLDECGAPHPAGSTHAAGAVGAVVSEPWGVAALPGHSASTSPSPRAVLDARMRRSSATNRTCRPRHAGAPGSVPFGAAPPSTGHTVVGSHWRAPRAYVRDTFDDFAGNFERQMLHGLRYRTPWIVRDAVDKAMRLCGLSARKPPSVATVASCAVATTARNGPRHARDPLSPAPAAPAAAMPPSATPHGGGPPPSRRPPARGSGGANGSGDVDEEGLPTWVVVDAGCGTGLCGPLLRDVAATLVGLDLSPRMLDKAQERRGVYDLLLEGDIVEELHIMALAGQHADMIVAADVLVYIGDITGFLGAASSCLRLGGVLAFSTEDLEALHTYAPGWDDTTAMGGGDGSTVEAKSESSAALALSSPGSADTAPVRLLAAVAAWYGHRFGPTGTRRHARPQHAGRSDGWFLQPSGRFAHSKGWVRAAAAQRGFETLVAETRVGRHESGKPVQCGVFVVRKVAEWGITPRSQQRAY